MDEKYKKEEVQSRRDFFKNAAKMALPFLAGVIIGGSPSIYNAVTKVPTGCMDGSCSGGCKGSGCEGKCFGGCEGCRGTCENGCHGDSN